jgi:hypothetical protein
MKKLKELKGLYNIFVDSVGILDQQIQKQLKEIKKEYADNLVDEKIKLLMLVCSNEGLDFNAIKSKYLKPKEIEQIEVKEDVADTILQEEDMLDKIEINGTTYYYQKKEKGNIYDLKSKQVGQYKNGQFIMKH